MAKKATTSSKKKVSSKTTIKKPTKKPARASKAKTIAMAMPMSDMKDVAVSQTSPMSNKWWTIAAVVVLALGVGAYYGKGLAVAALVNGRPISRLRVISELEKASGKEVMDGLITQELVAQAAQKQHIVISDQEADAEFQKLADQVKAQGQDIDQLLSLQGLTREALKKQIKLQKAVERLAGADAVEITDDEVAKYLSDNSSLFPKNLKADELKMRAADQLKRQKVQEKVQAYVEQMQQSAKVQYFVNY